jgi:hypothetical protein
MISNLRMVKCNSTWVEQVQEHAQGRKFFFPSMSILPLSPSYFKIGENSNLNPINSIFHVKIEAGQIIYPHI